MFSDRVYNINGWMVRLVLVFRWKEELLFSNREDEESWGSCFPEIVEEGVKRNRKLDLMILLMLS